MPTGLKFLVTEKIDGETLVGLPEEIAVKHAASAVRWLLNQPHHLPETCFGRIGSKGAPATACHPFFKDHEAPMAFTNSEALAQYLSVRVFTLDWIHGRR